MLIVAPAKHIPENNVFLSPLLHIFANIND